MCIHGEALIKITIVGVTDFAQSGEDPKIVHNCMGNALEAHYPNAVQCMFVCMIDAFGSAAQGPPT